MNCALTFSNTSIARANTQLTMPNVHFEGIGSTVSGIQRKHRKPMKSGPT